MAIHKNFYIYAGLTILALALSIGLFSWLNGVRPDVLSAPVGVFHEVIQKI